MLKTSSTKSAKPRKGVVGVVGGGRNRAEPVSKHKVDGDESDGCSGDFNKRFYPKLHGDFDVTFQVTRWRFGLCSSTTMIVFDCASEADHEKPITVALDWGSTLLVKVSIPIGKSSLPRLRQSSHVVLTFRCLWDAQGHSPWCLEQAHQRTHQPARPRMRSSMMRLMVVANWSKSRQKVEKTSKIWKICKGHRFGGMFTKVPIFR